MDRQNEETVETEYIRSSKIKIDRLLNNYNHHGAFNMLVVLLNKLDDSNKNEVLLYYQNYLTNKYQLNGTTLHPVSRY